MIAETKFPAMGATAHVLVIGTNRLLDAARHRLMALEAKWTRFRPDSELSRLNAVGRADVSHDTRDVILAAISGWHDTGGRYDPTILPALRAAGYTRSFAQIDGYGTAEPPVPTPGCAGIVVSGNNVSMPAGVELDLGGIAKGYAADLLAAELLALGGRGLCVNIGGDLRVAGESPGGQGWPLYIDGARDRAKINLAEGAAATSMRTRRVWTRNGVPQHHLIDPSTGAPADSGIAAVTVLAGTATVAEVWAKAAFMTGPDDAARMLSAQDLNGLIVADDGTEFRTGDFAEHTIWMRS